MMHERAFIPCGRLAGRTTPACLGAEPAMVAAEGHRRGLGGHQRSRQPMAQAGQAGGARSLTTAQGPRADASAHRDAAPRGAPAARTGAGGVWFPGSTVDRRANRPGHPAGLWGLVPPGPRRAHPTGLRVEPAETGAASGAAERGSDPPLARRALAGGQKKPRRRDALSSS